MTQEEQIRLYRLYCGKDRTGVLPGDSGFYIRYFVE